MFHVLLQNRRAEIEQVSSIEKGKYDPSLPLAFEIAKTFQTTIEHVFIYEGKEEGE